MDRIRKKYYDKGCFFRCLFKVEKTSDKENKIAEIKLMFLG
jgi:hypothetical protein